jgi:hypothetical protein
MADVMVNGVSVTTNPVVEFSNTEPAAPLGTLPVKFQFAPSGSVVKISGYVEVPECECSSGSSDPGSASIPPIPVFAGCGIEYMESVKSSQPTQATGGNRITYSLHYQEGSDQAYSAITVTVATAVSGSNMHTMLYSLSPNSEPQDLLWTSEITPTTTIGPKTMDFVSGTWTLAGDEFKDANGNLFLPYGKSVWKAHFPDSGNSWRCVGFPRSLGRPVDAASSPIVGYWQTASFPAIPDPAVPSNNLTTSLPMMVLKYA